MASLLLMLTVAAFTGQATASPTLPEGAVRRITPGDGAVRTLAFTPDGKALLSLCGRICRRWDVARGQDLLRLSVGEDEITAFAVAPDGRTLALGSSDRSIALRELPGGKELARLQGHEGSPSALAFAPDGRTLASGGSDTTVRLWDPKLARELHCLRGHTAKIATLAFSPDGKLLASSAAVVDPVWVWDIDAGKPRLQLGDPQTLHHSVVFSPNGRTILTQGALGIGQWEAATGNGLGRFGSFTREPNGLAFAPDGRTLWAVGSDDAAAQWELATNTLRRRLAGSVRALAVSPDGRLVATGSGDGTILLWDTLASPSDTQPLSAAALEAAWEELGAEDAARASSPMRALAAHAQQAVPLLRERLRPLPAERLLLLLADLDSDRFNRREKAMRELEARGKVIEPVLKEALLSATNLETRRRLALLLDKTVRQPTDPQQLRILRGIEILERLKCGPALRILEDLAQSAPGSIEQRESRGALTRLRAAGP